MKKRRKEQRSFLFFISPWLLGLIFLTMGPMLFSLFMSFTDWDMMTTMKFVGLRNYFEILFKSDEFKSSMKATFIWISFLPVGMILSLVLARLLDMKIKGKILFRSIIYIPVIVPAVVNCLLWLWLFNPNYGMINMILTKVGIPRVDWLLSTKTAMLALINMSLWQCGGNVLIFLAAMQGVSKDIYEAAEIDGAGSFKKYFSITLPMISPAIFFQLVMGVIGGLQVFTPAQLMTAGGPQKSTYFIVYYIYNKAFVEYDMGYASALSWILFFIILIIVLIIFKIFYKKVYYGS
jgi:multiple sugar transport system permease protein